ncbi:DUF748 domain-containing protein [Motiliproteus coralliicola]|uniref:DUF748 domain-containing protein n=1 Tax=Motiliproteus coralliicola TaxID=2283196 RepID=A0A369W885_9GAMM|nr:DUF748 domain-containing protein [Motiliproteus coralliicola]RDE18210.1 DUF748 domain-containing protein [Motiliproteus coralliicola]
MKNRKPLWIGSIMVALLLCISFVPALVLKLQLKQQLKQLGAEQVGLASAYLNPWTGYLEIMGLSAKSAGQPELKVGRFEAQISYAALWEQRLQLTRLSLADAAFHLRQQGSETRLGPLTLPKAAEEESDSSESTDWRWGLNGFQFDRLQASYQNPQFSQRLQIDQAILKLLYQWTPDKRTELTVKGKLNGSPISIDTRGTPLAQRPQLEFDVRLNRLDLAPLSAPWVPGLEGLVSTDLSITVEQLQDGFKLQQKGSLQLDSFAYQAEGLKTRSPQISWKGSAAQQLEKGNLRGVQSDNELQLQQLDLELADAGLTLKEQAISMNAKIDLDGTQKLLFDGSLNTEAAEINLPDLQLQNQSRGWRGQVDVALNDQGLQQLTTDGSLELQQLQLTQPQLQVHEQQITLTGKLETDLKQLLFNGLLETAPAQINHQQLQISNQSRRWQGDLALDLDNQQLSKLSGDLALGPIALQHQDGSKLVRLEQFSLQGLKTPAPNALASDRLQLKQLQLGDNQPLLTLDQLTITELAGSEQSAKLGQIEPGALVTRVDLNAERQPYRWLEWMAKLQPEADTKAAPAKDEKAPAQQQPPFPFELAQLTLQHPATILVSEYSPRLKAQSKPVQLTVSELSLAKLNTRSDQSSPFRLKAKANRFGEIELDGNYSLFAEKPNAQWQSNIKGMSLPPFSRFMNQATGYEFESGKLGLTSQGKINQGLLDSTTHLSINNLSVEPASQNATQEFDGQLGMPLGVAVALLTDDEDNVELDLPVKGSLDDPQFGIQSVINIVMAKVAKEAAMGYLSASLQPYGALLSLGRMALDAVEGSAINLDPVYFEPGSNQLTAVGEDYLTKIGGMLKERKGLRLKLCGLSVAADLDWLMQQRPKATTTLTASASAASTSAPLTPTPEELAQLQDLAEERGVTVKSYLIEDLQANDEQLFSCLAKVDPSLQLKPQVRMGL